jgi:uncharacterized protein (DUF2249 family)
MSAPATTSRTVDIRTLDGCANRKAAVLDTFDALEQGDSIEVVNDHLPRGLLIHFQERRPGRFEWTSIEDGPEVFRVRITKSTPA